MSTATPSKAKYTADDIEVLEGLEAVRQRPSMYIGGVDAKGLHHLLWEILDNCVDEYLAKEADHITFTLHKDGCSATITDNGRGIPVDKHKKTGMSALELILCTLHAGGKFSKKNYARSGGLHGVGSSVVNALSEELVATVRRDGYEWEQSFARGKPQGPVKKLREFRGHGTSIYFKPDDTIFRRVQFSVETIKQHIEDISYIHGGLKITFVDEAKNERIEYSYPDGIRAYLEKLTTEQQRKPVHDQVLAIEKDEEAIKTEVVFRWTEAPDENIRSYVNGIRTHFGGTHESGLRSGIVKAVKNYMEVHDVKVKGVTIGGEDIREGLIAVLSVFHGDPMFQGQTKDKLNNPEVAGQVEGLVRPALETWLNNNPSIADSIIGRIVLAARARAASREAAADVRRKSPSSRKLNLPGKLLDCRSKDSDGAELFIVEGDSAGGTAANGRDSHYQAVLPLRGKILNTESLAVSKILTNQEVTNIVETLGTGIGPNFDIHKLRYSRIILLMDADSDGYHITTLLLTFFFRHMPELIRSGKLYLAQPPLYRISYGSEFRYARDDAEKEAFVASLPANRKYEVQRFKGLGEMDAKQLKETTLDPKKRMLLRVDVDSQIEADRTFAQLLGKDASERYKLIMEESTFADDVDL
ncbi:MAG: type IIA DNA topoisomerase subunit B [Planctomycetaceae bacterium]|nr:type IIA DNA topoisomerase subunit B [Planctomycetaceae bacterium]